MIESIEFFFSDPHVSKIVKATCSYFTFFGTRYIADELKHTCGNMFENPYVKMFTLFCIFYQSSNSLRLAISLTFIITLFHKYMEKHQNCKKGKKY